MNEKGERMENLKTFVEEGRECLDIDSDLGLRYVDDIVIPESIAESSLWG